MEKMFSGIIPAIFSVYDENGNVLRETVKKMVDYQLEGGATGFYVGGNTGECTVIPAKIRKEMLEAVVEYNRGRGKIIAHVGAGHIDEVFELIDHANTLEIDAAASLPPALQPYYDIEETLEYYRAVAKRSKHPVLAYVTSVLEGDRYDFAKRLVEIDNVIGIKFSVPDYYTFGRIKETFGDEKYLFNGPDETLICGLSEGADAAIGTSYNMLPKVAVAIYESFKKGDMKTALEYQRKLNSFITLFLSENIAGWKAGMTVLGFDMGYTLFPQTPVSAEHLAEIKSELEKIGYFSMV